MFAQSDRDFNGRWYFKPERSDLQALPEPPEAIMKIEQHADVIHEFAITGKDGYSAEEIRTYNTDGSNSTRTFGQLTMSSQTKWEGAALLINTIVRTPHDNYSVAERWRLSKDGTRLIIVRQVIRGSSDTESTLVYEKTRALLPRPTTDITTNAPATTPNAELAVAAPAPTAPPVAAAAPDYLVTQGTKIPLRLMNSVDTKHSAAGDRVYLQTVYPVLSHGHVVIPPGSYVLGSLTEVKQAGRVKGKSSLFIRFDSLTLPNGTMRDFRARMSGMDGDVHGTLDRNEGTVQGESGKGADARTIGKTTAIGSGVGAAIGSAAGHLGTGLGIGAAAGALGGLAAVLGTRGPDAVLPRGATVEMVLDRDLTFTPDEVGRR